MKVSKFMTPKVFSAHTEDGIRKTYFRMREENVRHIPVIDDTGSLVGIVSDRDLRRPEWVDEDIDISHDYSLDDDMAVGDLMTTDMQVIHTYDTIRKANKLFLEHRFGALPVLNKEDDLVGIISVVDILKAFDQFIDEKSGK